MHDFREQLMGIRETLSPTPSTRENDRFPFKGLRSTAIQKVKNPLPVPSHCPYCNSAVKLVNNAELYHGKEYGIWPYAYLCENDACGAYVGLHPYTSIPLGSLATTSMRRARKKAKDEFNLLWKDNKPFTRSGAYAWLADQLGIDAQQCHIGWFDVQTCNLVVQICEQYWLDRNT